MMLSSRDMRSSMIDISFSQPVLRRDALMLAPFSQNIPKPEKISTPL